MIQVQEILTEMVEIPSYPRESKKDSGYYDIGEEKLAEYIEKFLRKNCPFLNRYERQPVLGQRYNLFVSNCELEEVKLIFCCHMDTVPEKEGQVYKKDSKNIYGLGSVDMKGGTAALLSILSGFNNLKKGILLIFYCDEEDGFAGMKKIVAEKNFFGNLAIFCEPTNLEIANGCRGLVDFEIFVKGKTAHGARPDQGKNVIFISASAFQELEKKIKVYTHKDLGSSVCNFGGFGAGLNTTDGEKILGYNIVMTGNNVPDLALARIEARTALPNLNADIVIKMFDEAVKKFRGKTELNKIIHDKGQLFVAPNQLKLVEEAILRSGIKAVYADLGGVGYYDGAMFYNAFDIPCISLGPGPHEISHQKEEYVSIASLKKIREIYKNIILNFGLIEM